MGFRMRKSINLGRGFRINLSKSGIGYSWGVPGYRVTQTAKGTTRRTYSIPGTGLSYVDETGKKNNRQSVPQYRTETPPPQWTRHIESAAINNFKTADICNVSSAIEKTILLNKISTFLILSAVLIAAHPLLAIFPILGIILKIVAHKIAFVYLDYSLDDEKADEYKRRIDAWQVLAECVKEWQVTQEAFVANQKVNAGAGRNVKRTVCKIEKTSPFYIKTNVDTIQLKLHKEILVFLPDKVFVLKKGKVGLVNYENITIRTAETNFIESDAVPEDAHIAGTTWQYVNKNGTQDMRFKNNRSLPICQYGVVYLSSSSGLNIEMYFSNNQKVRTFESLIR